MKVRIYIKGELKIGNIILLPEAKLNYIKNVLRLKTGTSIFVFNEKYGEFESLIFQEKKDILVKIIKLIKMPEKPLNARVSLVFANIKNNLTADILNSCTQIGVDEFFPITTQYSTNPHFSLQRGEKIIEEALEQCLRICPPTLNPLSSFDDVIRKLSKESMVIFCDEKADHKTHVKLPENLSNKNIFIFIGPEGGFSEEERVKLCLLNPFKISLGRFILRAETAAICAAFLISFFSFTGN